MLKEMLMHITLYIAFPRYVTKCSTLYRGHLKREYQQIYQLKRDNAMPRSERTYNHNLRAHFYYPPEVLLTMYRYTVTVCLTQLMFSYSILHMLELIKDYTTFRLYNVKIMQTFLFIYLTIVSVDSLLPLIHTGLIITMHYNGVS